MHEVFLARTTDNEIIGIFADEEEAKRSCEYEFQSRSSKECPAGWDTSGNLIHWAYGTAVSRIERYTVQ